MRIIISEEYDLGSLKEEYNCLKSKTLPCPNLNKIFVANHEISILFVKIISFKQKYSVNQI